MSTDQINIKTTSHTFTLKGIDAAITDSQTGTAPDVSDADSGQLAIYNGATKLWGINESGWVQNPNRPGFTAFGSSGRTACTQNTPLPMSNVHKNSGNCYDTSTYRFTAPISGFYHFSYGLYSYSTVQSLLYLNGSQLNFGSDSMGIITTASTTLNVGTINIELSPGDYLFFSLRNGYNSDVYLSHTFFSGFLIG